MCGEIDENVLIGQEVLERFRTMTAMLGQAPGGTADAAPGGLASAEGRAAYTDRLFRDGLARALQDAGAAEEEEIVDAIALQAIALARLAGFVAGQLPPEADLFRSVIEAVTAGHAETAHLAEQHRGSRSHDHGDHHGHRH